jgi:predicted ATPase
VKIAFIGTHGVGKTTLCFDLAARLKRLDVSVDIVKEVARQCPLPINRDTTLDAQAWILHTQIAQELALSSQYQAVVCDRSVLDNYAYLVHAAGRRTELDDLVRRWVRTYTGLFKVPVMAAPSFDGTRDLSEVFQREIDTLIDDLVEDMEVVVHRLDPQGRPGWIEAVLRRVGLPTEPPQFDLFPTSGG